MSNNLSGFTDDMFSAKRSTDVVYHGRKATWSNCAEVMSQQLGVEHKKSCIALKTPARHPKRREGLRHTPLAQVGSRQVQQEQGAWHVCGYASNKLVKTAFTRGMEHLNDSLLVVIDDHS